MHVLRGRVALSRDPTFAQYLHRIGVLYFAVDDASAAVPKGGGGLMGMLGSLLS